MFKSYCLNIDNRKDQRIMRKKDVKISHFFKYLDKRMVFKSVLGGRIRSLADVTTPPALLVPPTACGLYTAVASDCTCTGVETGENLALTVGVDTAIVGGR